MAEKGHRKAIAHYSENTGIGAGTHHWPKKFSLVWKINMKVIIESYEVSWRFQSALGCFSSRNYSINKKIHMQRFLF